MSTLSLLAPDLDGAVRWVNFFNGRLLSAEDMTTEQTATRERCRRLGRALGDGIAYGLEVKVSAGLGTAAAPVVNVAAGVAVNRLGQTLVLAEPADVALSQVADAPAAPPTDFAPCDAGGVPLSGSGAYLLVISPAGSNQGRALTSSLGNGDVACGTKYRLEAVQFRLILLGLADELADPDLARNRVAYRCFGLNDPAVSAYPANPFGPPPAGYGALDALRPKQLTDCDVPLAVLSWTAAGGIDFLDLWSVRRRLTRPDADGDWPLMPPDRRAAEGEAMFLQFQDHIEALAAAADAAQLVADKRFAYLPPVGLVPAQSATVPTGLDAVTFFGAHLSQDVALIDGNQLRPLLREAIYHEPIDLGTTGRVQVYVIWENVQAQDAGLAVPTAVVFASPTLPYRGVARFGYAAWSLSRFAPYVI